MTITIYELLGMIKDGKAPKMIKYKDTLYEYDSCNEFYFNNGWSSYREFPENGNCLNDEVEILEEENKKCTVETCCIGIEGLSKALLKIKDDMKSIYENIDKVETLEEEKKIPEKLEDISEIKCVGCKVEINIVGNKTLFDTDTPIVTEHCIYKINQLIKNQKKIIDYLKIKGDE